MASEGAALEPITVTVRRACEVSGLGRTHIYELMKQNKLKTRVLGRRRLIFYASLKALLLASDEEA